ncbi:aldo/keto reductase [Rhodococcus yananensis]|uniref:aldo/keto reductase n=1 Tax=Rhodococcus yananensis TaxID=2879464 RepID=UPI003EBF7885
MSILDETHTLSNGVEIPKLGLGTSFIDDDQAAQAVRDAVEIGYRNIDTAQAYGNEHGVGEGVRTAGVPRQDLFVSTKLAAEIKDHDQAAAAIDGSLQAMGLDHIDTNGVYAATKWGINGWSEALRQELLPDVRVTLIEPGVVDTELPSHITDATTRQAVQKSYDQATVKPEEIAEVIAFVLSRPRHLAINEVLLRPADQVG